MSCFNDDSYVKITHEKSGDTMRHRLECVMVFSDDDEGTHFIAEAELIRFMMNFPFKCDDDDDCEVLALEEGKDNPRTVDTHG